MVPYLHFVNSLFLKTYFLSLAIAMLIYFCCKYAVIIFVYTNNLTCMKCKNYYFERFSLTLKNKSFFRLFVMCILVSFANAEDLSAKRKYSYYFHFSYSLCVWLSLTTVTIHLLCILIFLE